MISLLLINYEQQKPVYYWTPVAANYSANSSQEREHSLCLDLPNPKIHVEMIKNKKKTKMSPKTGTN